MTKTNTSYRKLSKSDRQKIDRERRVLWSDCGLQDPRTRIAVNAKVYSRCREKEVWRNEY